MLPNISLDNEQFKDIMDDARNMIVALYPEWTDFNYHDPGITLLEMFSWIKESQQYYIDRIGSRHHEKYLKLLSAERRHKRPSRAPIRMDADKSLTIPAGTKFYAGDLCFETEKTEYIPAQKIAVCICGNGDGTVRVIDREQMDFGGGLRMYPFGKTPRKGECFYIGFEEPLDTDAAFGIRFSLYDGYPVKRNPFSPTEAFLPLAGVSVEFCSGAGWTEATLIRDDTHAFLTSGMMRLRLPYDMRKCAVSGRELYYLRFRLTEEEYDVSPMIQDVTLQHMEVVQKDTVSECVDMPSQKDGIYAVSTYLSFAGRSYVFVSDRDGAFREVKNFKKRLNSETGAIEFEIGAGDEGGTVRIVNIAPELFGMRAVGLGTGLPFQEFELARTDLLYESVELMSADPARKGAYRAWKRVRDFSRSGPSDLHYMFDSASGVIRFGDCKRGMAPEGEIFLVAGAYSLGKNGNVTAGKINAIDKIELPDIRITNPKEGIGGEDEESAEECFFRVRRLLGETVTAVTYGDYEKAAMETPGLMVESCHVIPANVRFRPSEIPPELTVSLAVKPYGAERKKKLSPHFEANMRNHLEKRRTLGTYINIIAAEYAEISVYADITVRSHYKNSRAVIEEAISAFFRELADDFGAEIPYSKLYGTIDILDCVESINSLSMETTESGVKRTRDGNLLLAPNGLCVLHKTELLLTTE